VGVSDFIQRVWDEIVDPKAIFTGIIVTVIAGVIFWLSKSLRVATRKLFAGAWKFVRNCIHKIVNIWKMPARVSSLEDEVKKLREMVFKLEGSPLVPGRHAPKPPKQKPKLRNMRETFEASGVFYNLYFPVTHTGGGLSDQDIEVSDPKCLKHEVTMKHYSQDILRGDPEK
jgi:hypothetical protein